MTEQGPLSVPAHDLKRNLAAALALVQTKLPTIEKHQTADTGSYKYEYADLADVSEPLLPLLGDAGLSWTCRPTFNERGEFVLAYALMHTSGEQIEGEYPLPKSGTSQAVGAAITYARRYALCAVTGAAPRGDDDDAAEAPKTRTAQRQSRPARQQADSPAPAQRTAQRARVDGPPLPGDDDSHVTKPQLGKLGALFSEAGITDREARLDTVRRIIGRGDLTTSSDLSKQEASMVIERLEKEGVPDGPADGDWDDPRLHDAQETLPVDDGRSALAKAQDKAKEGT